MSVATGDLVTMVFTTTNPATGAAADADSLPTGALWVDGVANAATVTIADATGTGRYTFEVTMPTLTAGQRVQMVVDATIGGVACAGVVWEDQAAPAVSLVNDAITAGKFDESTAFPLKAADAGSTYVARTGADGDTLETLSDQIDGVGGATGSGAISFPVTVNDEDSNPIDGVEVWISTDSAGASVVAGTLSTDALGVVTFMLDAGTYYLWRQKSGYNFTNPVTITVS